MRIEKFLEKINYKIKSGSIYQGKELKDLLLYSIKFMNIDEKEEGFLLLSAKNKNIYFIKYNSNQEVYYYRNKLYDYTNKDEKEIILKEIITLITKK